MSTPATPSRSARVVTRRERDRSWRVAAVKRAVVARPSDSVRVDIAETLQPRADTWPSSVDSTPWPGE
ncbi:hypothetical protein [Schaalia odontolytica]